MPPRRRPRAAGPLLPPALLLAAALAGCVAEPPVLEGDAPLPAGPPVPGAGGDAGPLAPGPQANVTGPVEFIAFDAPVWVRGDSWTFRVDTDTTSGTQRFVVHGETSEDYLLASTDAEDAITQAFFGRSLPGRVSKRFLSGYDGGVPTHYLDFPLAQNKTWSIHVRGLDLPVRANFTRALEAGHGPGFVIEGASLDGSRIALTYAPGARWMTRFELLLPDGGFFRRGLTAHATNYTGPYYTVATEELYAGQRNGTSPAAPFDQFTQARDHTQLRLALQVRGQGGMDLRVLDPAGQPRFNFTGPGPGPGAAASQVAVLPSAAGTWRVTYGLLGPVEVALRVAGVDVTEGEL